jgi:RHS repeat-associated protein
MSYDPLGRLFQAGGGTSDVIRYLYDGDALVAEYNTSGTMLRRYVHGSGVDEPLLWYEGATVSWQNRRQLIADNQSSIVAITDWIGNPLYINRYDEYGIPAATNVGRFGYTGQVWLPALGMYYYKARIYSPTLGRFLQTDPVGYKDQFNLYAYVGNDPVNRTDPTGMCFLDTNTGNYVGVCAFSAAEGAFVGDLLTDEGIHDLDVEAGNAGRTILVRFGDATLGSRRPDGSWSKRPEPVNGEKMEVEEEGQRRIIVNVDRTDRMTVYGHDQRTGRPMSHVNTSKENAAHGLGHAQDEVRRTNSGEAAANAMENGYRQKHRIDVNFRREGHGGRRDDCTGRRLC